MTRSFGYTFMDKGDPHHSRTLNSDEQWWFPSIFFVWIKAYCWSMNARLVEIETEAESNYLEYQLRAIHQHGKPNWLKLKSKLSLREEIRNTSYGWLCITVSFRLANSVLNFTPSCLIVNFLSHPAKFKIDNRTNI